MYAQQYIRCRAGCIWIDRQRQRAFGSSRLQGRSSESRRLVKRQNIGYTIRGTLSPIECQSIHGDVFFFLESCLQYQIAGEGGNQLWTTSNFFNMKFNIGYFFKLPPVVGRLLTRSSGTFRSFSLTQGYIQVCTSLSFQMPRFR